MTRKAALALPLLLLAPLALESCRDPTEIKVTVSTDLDCPGLVTSRPHLGKTELYVADESGTFGKVAETSTCGAAGRVGDLVFVPGRSDRVRLRVVGDVDLPGRPKPEPITSDRLVSFVPHTPLEIPIELSASCIGVKCGDPDTTCARGQCVPIQATCVGRRCDVDASAPADAAPADAAPLDAGAGDAGVCPSFLAVVNYRWPFDEGAMATQVIEQVTKTPSQLTGMLTAGGPCNGLLTLGSTKTQKLLGTAGWSLPKFGISFWLYYAGGTGIVLSRGAPDPGGFIIDMQAQVMTFSVYGASSSGNTGTNPPPLNQWSRIYATHSSTGQSMSVNGQPSPPVSPVPAFITSPTSDVILGGGNISFAIADLQLGSP